MIRQTLSGFMKMGRPRIPPIPSYIEMVDRTDGTVYVLGQTGSAGSLTLNLSATLPASKQSHTLYGKYDGPYLTHPDGRTVKLYVASGELQGEFIEDRIRTRRILTRNGYKRTVMEITVPAGWEEGDDFTFTEVSLEGD